jgi:YkoY family integral membrane protein
MLAVTFLGQDMHWGDLGVVGLLILLEGVLSIDNALVLGLLAKRLPPELRKKALTYGLVGAFAFRFLAIGVAAFLLEWNVVKLIGGGYLAYIAIRHLFFETHEDVDARVKVSAAGEPELVDRSTGLPITERQEQVEIDERAPAPFVDAAGRRRAPKTYAKFWPTVIVIELTDIAFAVDSILAAIALVGRKPPGYVGVHPKLWVIITGGILGVILMRFAAVVFIKLLERFPRFETAAYILVAIIGGKLLADWGFNSAEHHRLDFHDWHSPEFWVFWILMVLGFLSGFLPQRAERPAAAPGNPNGA